MVKKTTLKEVGDMLVHVVKHMATKEDLKDLRKDLKGDIKDLRGDIGKLDHRVATVETRLQAVEGKVSGIDRRLDVEAMRRDDEKIPVRVGHLEKKVFGASRAS